ncbi:MAG: hypothetical protein ACYDCC_03435 [Actinomycetota bacterium]
MTLLPQESGAFPLTAPAPDPLKSPRRPVPASARPRHLRVVRGRPAPGRRPPAPIAVILAGLATAAALFAMVSVQSLVGQTEIRKSAISKQIDHEKDVLESLQVDVTNASSLDRIAARASKLGLIPPPSITFLTPPAAGSVSLNLSDLTVPSYVEPSPQPASSASNGSAASSASSSTNAPARHHASKKSKTSPAGTGGR